VQLNARQADGASLRAHLQAAARVEGEADPRLSARVPEAGTALWDAFNELNASRPVGMGPGAILHSEILAWQALHRVRLTGWEVDTLKAMDHAALAAMAEASTQATQQQKGKR
jgi:hypothetical protein